VGFLINGLLLKVRLIFVSEELLKITPLDPKIEGPKLIEIDAFKDERGFFSERFNLQKFKDLGLPHHFVQDAHSRSEPGVLRGLHIQYDPSQGKLVWVAAGKILDVLIDCRIGSSTFLKSISITLDSANPGQVLLIPEGFAHGFCVLGNQAAHVIYKISAGYNPKGETGLKWNDPELNIDWPVKNPIVSGRDQKLLSVSEFRKKFSK
jgi:dTDP-4-dehydrorhamnose 3,5-epimerase